MSFYMLGIRVKDQMPEGSAGESSIGRCEVKDLLKAKKMRSLTWYVRRNLILLSSVF
jgi:hypothetical protein